MVKYKEVNGTSYNINTNDRVIEVVVFLLIVFFLLKRVEVRGFYFLFNSFLRAIYFPLTKEQ
jgi:hypothetical protein